MADVVTAPPSHGLALTEPRRPDPLQQTKIPIWTGPECKVLGGVSRLTTCAEVVRLLVAADEDPAKYAIVEKWRKMERRLEPNVRILKVWTEWGDQKGDVALILRPLHAHAFSTTNCANYNDGYIDKRGCSSRVLRRKTAGSHSNGHGVHKVAMAAAAATDAPNASAHNAVDRDTATTDDETATPLTESMERILSLVLTQGETIQAQLRKLRVQEEQIERYEEQMHRIRSLKDGENYVVDSYLDDQDEAALAAAHDKGSKGLFGLGRSAGSSLKRRDKRADAGKLSSKGKSKERTTGKKRGGGKNAASAEGRRLLEQLSPKVRGVDEIEPGRGDDPSAASPEDDGLPISCLNALLEQKELIERICEVNSELTKEEERLVKLGLKIRKYQQSANGSGRHEGDGEASSGDDEDVDDEGSLQPTSEHQQQLFASQLGLELEALRRTTAEQSFEIEQNEAHLTEIEALLDEKHDCIVHLTHEIQLMDVESDQLQQRLLQITSTTQQKQQQQPPPYEQALTSSMLANFLLPHSHGFDDPEQQQTGCCKEQLEPQTQGRTGPTGPSKAVPNFVGVCPCGCNASANANYCQYPPTPALTPTAPTHPSSTPGVRATTTTEFSLHSDDSNSDTGISSLHSSGDENTLFALDTLV